MAQPTFRPPTSGWLGDRGRRAAAGAGLFVLSLLIGGGVGWWRADPSPAPGPSPSPTTPSVSTPTPEPDPTPTSESPSPEPTPTPTEPTPEELEEQALEDLEQQASADLARAELDGEWVAQVSSKYVGVRDPRQRTATGSHVFEAVDIWAEHEQLRKMFEADDEVLLLRSDDYGKRDTHDGDTYWRTFVVGDFESAAAVTRFCRSAFPTLSAEDLGNQCFANRLRS